MVGRKYGLTCDAIESVQIVTADGRILDLRRGHQRRSLLGVPGWGRRELRHRDVLHVPGRAHPALALFTLDWPWAAAADVLGAWFAWQHAAPDELWSNCQLLSGGSGTLEVRTAGMFVGSTASLGSLGRRRSSPRWGAQPSYRFVGPEQYLHAMLVEAGCESLDVAQCHLTTQSPAGTLAASGSVASSAYVSTHPVAGGHRPPSSRPSTISARPLPELGGGLVFDAYGRSHQRREARRHRLRPPQCHLRHPGQRGHGGERDRRCAAGPGLVGALRRRGVGLASTAPAYQNYIDPTLADWQQAYYGANLARLVSVKAHLRPRRRVPLRPVHPHPSGSGAVSSGG